MSDSLEAACNALWLKELVAAGASGAYPEVRLTRPCVRKTGLQDERNVAERIR